MATIINANNLGLIQTTDATGNVQFQTANTAAMTIDNQQNITLNGTGALTVPVGNTAQRPANSANGSIRYNTTTFGFETYVGGNWTNISTGAYSINYLVVAGGAGGAGNLGGGGGAGGYLSGSLVVTPGTQYTVTVGAGAAGNGGGHGLSGSNTVFSAISTTAIGGGGGSCGGGASAYAGGSGGGAGYNCNTPSAVQGGAGVPGQGNAGGSTPRCTHMAAGGGGAGGAGQPSPSSTTAGAGGVGLANSISGSSVYYAGGGGGGAGFPSQPNGGAGGSGGGGHGANTPSTPAVAGTVNTGGGGGGGTSGCTPAVQPGSGGGSGIVIISYVSPVQRGLGGTVTTSGNNYIHTFNSSSTYTA